MTAASSELRLLEQHDVHMNADCAESLRSKKGAYVAVGSYKLDESSQKRLGQILLFSVDRAKSKSSLNRVYTRTGIPGVFELKWNDSEGQPLLGCAAADGRFYTFPLDEEPRGLGTEAIFQTSAHESEAYCLSCDWSPWAASSQQDVVVSRSDGRIAILDLATSTLRTEWLAHSYPYLDRPAEVWYAAYSKWKPNVVYSGADDALLKCWDVSSPDPVCIVKSKQHTAGICAIQFSPSREYTFVTGSYDNAIRMWDERKLARPVATHADLHGGVWRLKWHPRHASILVAACMRGGFAVLRCDSAFEVLATYSEAAPGDWEALAYGVDWLGQDEESLKSHDLLCGVSFYDKKLHLFSIDLDSQVCHG